MRLLLGFVAAVVVPLVAFAQDDPLVGAVVFPRTPDAQLRDDAGKSVSTWGSAPGRVVKVTAAGRVQVVSLYPSEVPPAWTRRSEVVKLADAVAFFTDTIRADPDDPWGYEMRAAAYTESRQPAKAVDDLTEAIKIDATPRRHFLRGNAWSAAGNAAKAVADYTSALRLDPTDYHTLNNRGLLFTRERQYDKAEADFAEAIRLRPTVAVAFHSRGCMWDDRGLFGRAITDFTEAIRLDPRFTLAYSDRGRSRLGVPDPAAALTDYAEAIRLDPAVSNNHYGLGVSHELLKDYDKAFESYTTAARLGPNDPLPHSGLGNMWRRKGEYEKAAAAYTEGIRRDPKSADLFCRRGETWDDFGDFGKASVDYAVAARLSPDFAFARYRLAWLLATCPDEAHRDGAKAVALATKLCEQSGGKVAEYLDALAAAHAEAGDFGKAVEASKKALALPGVPPAFARDYRERLKLYEAEQPFRQPSGRVAPPQARREDGGATWTG